MGKKIRTLNEHEENSRRRQESHDGHRVRLAMATDQEQSDLLHGIVEADEVYIGGKPRKGNRRDGDADTLNKRGRGTKKTAVIGVTERLGRVIAKVAEAHDLSAKGLLKFVCKFVDTDASLVITDEYSGYNGLAAKMRHARINHSIQYADGFSTRTQLRVFGR
jgi:hypothetical protein